MDKQELKLYLKAVKHSKERAVIYLNAIKSIKKALAKKDSVYIKAGILMLARVDLIDAKKFDESLESPKQQKVREAVNDLIALIDDMLITHLQDNLLSEESLHSLMEEIEECMALEMDYTMDIAMKGTGLERDELEKLLDGPGYRMYKAFKEKNL